LKKLTLDKSITLLEKPETPTYRKACFELLQKRSLAKNRSYLFALPTVEDLQRWIETIKAIENVKLANKEDRKRIFKDEGKHKEEEDRRHSREVEEMRKKLEEMKKRELEVKEMESIEDYNSRKVATKNLKRVGDYLVGKTLGEGNSKVFTAP
jgi:hypothetical protein